MNDPEARPDRPGADPVFAQCVAAGAMALLLLSQLLRVWAGGADVTTWLLLIGSAFLLAVNVRFLVRGRRERRNRP